MVNRKPHETIVGPNYELNGFGRFIQSDGNLVMVGMWQNGSLCNYGIKIEYGYGDVIYDAPRVWQGLFEDDFMLYEMDLESWDEYGGGYIPKYGEDN